MDSIEQVEIYQNPLLLLLECNLEWLERGISKDWLRYSGENALISDFLIDASVQLNECGVDSIELIEI